VRDSKRYSRETGSESLAICAHPSGLGNRPRDEAWALGTRTERNDRATNALLVRDLRLGLDNYFQSIRADEVDAVGGSAADG
jgi:hypothetical protein